MTLLLCIPTVSRMRLYFKKETAIRVRPRAIYSFVGLGFICPSVLLFVKLKACRSKGITYFYYARGVLIIRKAEGITDSIRDSRYKLAPVGIRLFQDHPC